MNPITFSLPWPPSALSPNRANGRSWKAMRGAKDRYRDNCAIVLMEQRVKAPTAPRLDVVLQFVPPDRARHDRDNLIARMKHGLDGVAKVWGIDDSQFVRLTAWVVDSEIGKREACVLVTVTEHVVTGVAP